MHLLSRTPFLLFFAVAVFFVQNAEAIPGVKKRDKEALPTVLKADEVNGDKVTNTLTAEGNVEVAKGNSVVYADKVTYNKNGGIIKAIGHVEIKDIEAGNVRARDIEIKDDFSSGVFNDSKLFFSDGSYLTSPKIERKTPLVTVLTRPIYSICPNPAISENNDLAGTKADFFTIKSSSTTIDRENEVIVSKHGVIRFYNVPVLYTPYLRNAIASKKRQSGFLYPNYVKSSIFGLGLKTPYYWNIAPNMDLTLSPTFSVAQSDSTKDQFILNNEFRHLTSYGDYKLNFEVANNKITSTNDSTVVSRTNAKYRWHLQGNGIFDFTNNTGLDFTLDQVSDRNYLRDYYFQYPYSTLSKVNLDYIKGRSYHSVKVVKIQELESVAKEKFAPLALPVVDSHIETKPLSHNQKLALTSNMTVISREEGLQYRRLSLVPEVNVPYNVGGNLFTANAKFQTDAYWLENNFKSTTPTTTYDDTQTNYKPELSLNWRLPLIKKAKFNTIVIEPMANIVVSSYGKNFNKMPDEDSNGSELTVSNLFVSDRLPGFDRNEAGQRASYGVKTSIFNPEYGEFGLTLGQSYRRKASLQDVTISGFHDNDKSNFVGQALYKTAKIFSLIYSFQLNESSYVNDVNQLTASLNFDLISFSADYLFIRKNISQSIDERQQVTFSSSLKLTGTSKLTIGATKNLATNQIISRSLTLSREGCCTTFGFKVVSTKPSNLNKAQRTYNLSLLFKNL